MSFADCIKDRSKTFHAHGKELRIVFGPWYCEKCGTKRYMTREKEYGTPTETELKKAIEEMEKLHICKEVENHG